MTPEFYVAVALGALSWFMRARLQNIPHRVSEAGILSAIVLLVWTLGAPQTMPPWQTLLLFFIAALCVGGGVHFWQGKAGAGHPARSSQMTDPKPTMGDGNTLVDVDQPSSMGSGNTIVRTTDPNGNTILNKGGVAIGAGAQADPTSIAIGAGANAGDNKKKDE
jgi:hypothetical protein